MFPVESRTVEKVDGELQEVVATFKPRKKVKVNPEQASAYTLEALAELGRMRGYAKPEAWAQHIIDSRSKRRSAK